MDLSGNPGGNQELSSEKEAAIADGNENDKDRNENSSSSVETSPVQSLRHLAHHDMIKTMESVIGGFQDQADALWHLKYQCIKLGFPMAPVLVSAN
jgi:hypothetical protein